MPEDQDTPVAETDLTVVSWYDPDGSVAQSCPLPRAHAEALARAYARADPRGHYWTRPVPWLKSKRDPRRHEC